MSGYSCRGTYYNYGSYLRSRGYDKEVCNLVSAFETGKISYGAITSHPGEGAIINGTLIVKLANSPVPSVDMTEGQIYVPNMSSVGSVTNTVRLGTDGRLYKDTSSMRYKTNIMDMPRELGDMTYSLQPRIYNRPNNDSQEIGLIAEEVHDVGLKHVVIYDTQGRPDALAYDRLVVPLVQVVKDQKDRIDALEARIVALEQPK